MADCGIYVCMHTHTKAYTAKAVEMSPRDANFRNSLGEVLRRNGSAKEVMGLLSLPLPDLNLCLTYDALTRIVVNSHRFSPVIPIRTSKAIAHLAVIFLWQPP